MRCLSKCTIFRPSVWYMWNALALRLVLKRYEDLYYWFHKEVCSHVLYETP